MAEHEDKQIQKLEEVCDICHGRGWLSEGGTRETCDACDGAGFVPTAFGEEVLKLMRHNFNPMLAQARD